jgi:hypothetical protein
MADLIPQPISLNLEHPENYAVAQAVYGVVTGKTEKLIRTFSKNYRIRFADIEQLHFKFEQMCTQWHVIQSSSNITLNHVDDNKEVFSSLDRFRIYDVGRMAALESVIYEFNFLLKLPLVEKPQQYTVTVRLHSRAAAFLRIEEQDDPPMVLRLFNMPSIIIEISYVDYVVARNVMSMFESWVTQIETGANPHWLKFFQDRSHWIPEVFRFGLGIVTTATFFIIAPLILEAADAAKLARFILLAVTACIGFSYTGGLLGALAENSIDNIVTVSLILINKGDERLADHVAKRNLGKVIWAIGSFIFTVALGIAVNIVSAPIVSKLFSKH